MEHTCSPSYPAVTPLSLSVRFICDNLALPVPCHWERINTDEPYQVCKITNTGLEVKSLPPQTAHHFKKVPEKFHQDFGPCWATASHRHLDTPNTVQKEIWELCRLLEYSEIIAVLEETMCQTKLLLSSLVYLHCVNSHISIFLCKIVHHSFCGCNLHGAFIFTIWGPIFCCCLAFIWQLFRLLNSLIIFLSTYFGSYSCVLFYLLSFLFYFVFILVF